MSDALTHYLNAWNLSDPQSLAETPTSHVYTVTWQGERVVLKLLTPIGIEERSGAATLRCFEGQGAVRLLRDDEDAHLLEYADGDDLTGMVRSGNDEQAAVILGEVLNQLHRAKPAVIPGEILPLRIWFRSLFAKADADQRDGLTSIYTKAAAIADDLLSHPRDVCILHGDMHHENVRSKVHRGWLAFDPKGLVGERTFDAANILRNPHTLPDLVHDEARLLKIAAVLADTMKVDVSRLLTFTFIYACLSATWWLGDGIEPVSDLIIARIVEEHLRFPK